MKSTLQVIIVSLTLIAALGCGNSAGNYTGKPKGKVDSNGIETFPEGTKVVRDDGLK